MFKIRFVDSDYSLELAVPKMDRSTVYSQARERIPDFPVFVVLVQIESAIVGDENREVAIPRTSKYVDIKGGL